MQVSVILTVFSSSSPVRLPRNIAKGCPFKTKSATEKQFFGAAFKNVPLRLKNATSSDKMIMKTVVGEAMYFSSVTKKKTG